MKRNLTVERLYTLGDFQNIKFTNTITDIPQELSGNDNIIGLLFLQGGLSCDIAYSEYQRRRDAIKNEKVKDVLERLKEEREQTYLELKNEIESVYDDKKEYIGVQAYIPNKETTNE